MHLAHFRKKLVKQRRFRQAVVASIVLAIGIGFLIVQVEKDAPGALIRDTSDGLWWSIQTVTTIGYGDVVPVTDPGRLLGVVLQIFGAVLMGVLIAMVSTTMTRSQEEFYWNRLFQRLDDIETKIKYLEKSQTLLVKETIKDDKSEPATGSSYTEYKT